MIVLVMGVSGAGKTALGERLAQRLGFRFIDADDHHPAKNVAKMAAGILADNEKLTGVAPVVADSGEGRWTALESVELGVPTPVITMALMARFSSQGRSDYSRRLLAMMRAKFGGHAVGTTG